MLRAMEAVISFKPFWIIALFAVLYAYLKFVRYAHWKKLGVPHSTPIVPFGNALSVLLGTRSLEEYIEQHYQRFKNNRFSGIYMFHKAVLVINDPELIRHILVKDFNKFSSRGFYHNERIDPMTANLFMLSGEKWKKIRSIVSPTFTSKKLKEMFPLLKDVSVKLGKCCDEMFAQSDVVEIKDLIGRYTIDSISSIAFGLDCQSLDNANNEFKRHVVMAFDMSPIRIALASFAPTIMNVLGIPLFDRKLTSFFMGTFKDVFDHRRQNGIVRKDFFNLLMQLMDKGVLDDNNEQDANAKVSKEDKLTWIEALAQSFVFFLAGYETTSTVATYVLYELALRPDIQENVHREVDEFFAEGEITYNRIKEELPYLDMVVSETMRFHVFPVLNRVCVEDWTIPNTDIHVKKGTSVVVPTVGLHNDPDIFPNPKVFDPTRFTEENISARSPYVYLPFGSGPKNCIGARFATIQTKLALIPLLRRYKFWICKETIVPVVHSKKSFVPTPECDVNLRLEKRIK